MNQPAATTEAAAPPNPAHILAALDPEQAAVARQQNGHLCVLAGAGTGKTRAITHRIAFGVHSGLYQPQQVMAVTFTTRAASELRSRLKELGVIGAQTRTFHSAALRQLQYFWPRIIGGNLPTMISSKAPLVAAAAKRARVSTDRTTIRDLAGEIEWANVSMVTRAYYPQKARETGRGTIGELSVDDVVRVMEFYERIKDEKKVMDFEDILITTAAILREHPHAKEQVQRQYRHIVVDEYQDVSPVQQHLVDLWVGQTGTLCVVGDAAQTIYSFAGATPQYLTGFTGKWTGASKIQLVRNYRSTQEIVELANQILSGAPAHYRKSHVTLRAQQVKGTKPVVQQLADDDEEGKWVVAEVKKMISNGIQPQNIAVLYRTNSQSEPVERAFNEAKMGYQIRGAEQFFVREEVREAIVRLRGVRTESDGSVPLDDMVKEVVSAVGWQTKAPDMSGATRQRWESLQALVDVAERMRQNRRSATIDDLLHELDERREAQNAPTINGVTLASLHSTKGLEWDHVFLIGVSDGLIPFGLAKTPESIEEERRLLYVGVTRARETLRLSWAASRHPGGAARRSLSRFIQGAVGQVKAKSSRTVPPRVSRSKAVHRCRVCGVVLETGSERKIGRCNNCPPSYDQEVFDRLREWNRLQANHQSVPAFVVFTMATLTVVAETMPTDLQSLRKVPGIGAVKLDHYGEALLAVLGGAEPENQLVDVS